MSTRGADVIVEEAAQWMARLQSGDCSEDERSAFDAWRSSNPVHEEVIQRMSGGLDLLQVSRLRALGDDRLLKILNAPSSRRKILRRGLGALGVVTTAAVIGRVTTAGLALPGDLYTRTGERRDFVLADGSALTLNARSRVRPRISGEERRLSLHVGEMLLKPVADPLHPFHVDTAAGRLQTDGGIFTLRDNDDGSFRLAVIASEVRLVTPHGGERSVAAGQSVRFDAGGGLEAGATQGDAAAWTRGLLEADNLSLGEVVAVLRDYRRGVLRISPEAARLRVSGLFPLDDTDRALNLLARTLPIEVSRRSDYWVTIGLG